MGAPTSSDARDHLIVSWREMRYPILNVFMHSVELREDLLDVAREIMGAWVSSVPHETGNLSSTARAYPVRGHGIRGAEGWRWEAIFEAGGARAPYAREVEEEHHTLERVLEGMGYFGVVV